jgi:hypothetical protein
LKAKTTIATFLLLLVTLSSIGVSFEKHYCMGRLKAITWHNSEILCCGGMAKAEMVAMGCCHDETVQVETSELEIPVSGEFNIEPIVIPAAEIKCFFAEPLIQVATPQLSIIVHPPPLPYSSIISWTGALLI